MYCTGNHQVQNLFPKILHVIDTKLLHKHFFPKLADGSMETKGNYANLLQYLVYEDDSRDFIVNKSTSSRDEIELMSF